MSSKGIMRKGRGHDSGVSKGAGANESSPIGNEGASCSGVSKGAGANESSPIGNEGASCAPTRSLRGRRKESNVVRDPCEIECLEKSPPPLSKTKGLITVKSRAGQDNGIVRKKGAQARAGKDSGVSKGSKIKGLTPKDNVTQVLLTTLDKLRIRKSPRSESTAVINTIVENIVKYLKRQTDCFRQVTSLRTGSYYENVKVGQPDEFDVILAIRVQSVDLREFGDDGAFYSVAVKEKSRGHPLADFLHGHGVVSASEMLAKFRTHVKNALDSTAMTDVQVERKRKGSPAVTLLVKKDGLQISLDVVLGLEVHSTWPPVTKSGFLIEKWLGTKVKKEFRFKPFYLVPKYEGNGSDAQDGICAKDAWRISFSHVEKDILKSHGSAKTCCEAQGTKCCRRECLKLLKHLLEKLKEKYPKDISKFCSYHAKSTLFHACAEYADDSDWKMEQLDWCFLRLLEDFQNWLRKGVLPNFFIPTHNVLGSKCNQKSCNLLADYIDFEKNNMFPIFLE
ncbi:cyclic GMP-AMP synthase [Brienomyrus brachyistius]|uniref:cyclic GMP-AMP synthase n=1 Tax=Brienomyrus brachyistius TaxID=42636 RepID=UPI0020B3B873|nr:cyclic GMP-AMP synthase [Brienomyrus brachyistius]